MTVVEIVAVSGLVEREGFVRASLGTVDVVVAADLCSVGIVRETVDRLRSAIHLIGVAELAVDELVAGAVLREFDDVILVRLTGM